MTRISPQLHSDKLRTNDLYLYLSVKVFWGKRHHQKLPWEWKSPSLSEMVSRAQEVHNEQVRPSTSDACEAAVLDEQDLESESGEDRSSEADCWTTLLGAQRPDNRSVQGVGRYPLRLTDPWFEGSELQKNPSLSLGSLLDRSSGSWSSPSPLALSSSQPAILDVCDSRTSSPASSLTSGRSSASSTLFSSSSSVTSSPRSSVFASGHWGPGETLSSWELEAPEEWSPSYPH